MTSVEAVFEDDRVRPSEHSTLLDVQRSDVANGEDVLSLQEFLGALFDSPDMPADSGYRTSETRVGMAGDAKAVIRETTDEGYTVCVKAVRAGAISQARFGSLPEDVGERAERAVVMARCPGLPI